MVPKKPEALEVLTPGFTICKSTDQISMVRNLRVRESRPLPPGFTASTWHGGAEIPMARGNFGFQLGW